VFTFSPEGEFVSVKDAVSDNGPAEEGKVPATQK